MGENLLKEIEKGSKMAVMKKKIITHYIYSGSSTITDLAREMDLSVPTVTKFIDEMCEEGYINDYGKLETSGGRHPSLYGLNADSGYFVGVEVRQFSINLGLINFKGDVVQLKMNVPFKAKNTPESLDELCKLIKHFLQKVSVEKDKILNINVNLSGRVNPDLGYSYSIFNFDERPLTDVISEKVGGYRVSIDNDTRAMIYGEYMQGVVKGEKNIIFINVSWGLGMKPTGRLLPVPDGVCCSIPTCYAVRRSVGICRIIRFSHTPLTKHCIYPNKSNRPSLIV